MRTQIFLLALCFAQHFCYAQLAVEHKQSTNKNPTLGNVVWTSSIVQSSNSQFLEGQTVLQRIILKNIPANPNGKYKLLFRHDAIKRSHHAYDFIVNWTSGIGSSNSIIANTFVNVDTCSELSIISPEECTDLGNSTPIFAAAVPSAQYGTTSSGDSVMLKVAAFDNKNGGSLSRQIELRSVNGMISNAELVFKQYTLAGINEEFADYELTWDGPTSGSPYSVMIKLGLHLAISDDGSALGYGESRGAQNFIDGGPYHFFIDDLYSGEQEYPLFTDAQISAAEIYRKFYQDADGDGFGNPLSYLIAIEPPSGYVTNGNDCDDSNPTLHLTFSYFVDQDHDGYGSTTSALSCSPTAPEGYSTNNTDCNDTDALIHQPLLYFVDADHDGYGSAITELVCSSSVPFGYSSNNTDCDDHDSSIHPNAPEICGNGIDDNCDGQVDEGCCFMTVSAGTNAKTYFGYDPQQCISRTADVVNGTAPYTYSWTLDRPLLHDVITSSGNESITGANTSTVTVCLLDTANLCVTVTDTHGCTASGCVTIYGEDVRCFSGNINVQKVKMCHNGNIICVSANSVDAHLAEGDSFCDKSASQRFGEATERISDLKVFPNPFIDFVKIQGLSPNSTVQVIDITGRTLITKKLNADATLKMGELSQGVYFLKTEKGLMKIIKTN